MRELVIILKKLKECHGVVLQPGLDGFSCQIPRQDYAICVIMSNGQGWEHVSAHCRSHGEQFTPFWNDMCLLKDMFFEPTELVIQYHPPESEYINIHEHVLHLWRPKDKEIPLPPSEMV